MVFLFSVFSVSLAYVYLLWLGKAEMVKHNRQFAFFAYVVNGFDFAGF
jgi:hypothetical protein